MLFTLILATETAISQLFAAQGLADRVTRGLGGYSPDTPETLLDVSIQPHDRERAQLGVAKVTLETRLTVVSRQQSFQHARDLAWFTLELAQTVLETTGQSVYANVQSTSYNEDASISDGIPVYTIRAVILSEIRHQSARANVLGVVSTATGQYTPDHERLAKSMQRTIVIGTPAGVTESPATVAAFYQVADLTEAIALLDADSAVVQSVSPATLKGLVEFSAVPEGSYHVAVLYSGTEQLISANSTQVITRP